MSVSQADEEFKDKPEFSVQLWQAEASSDRRAAV